MGINNLNKRPHEKSLYTQHEALRDLVPFAQFEKRENTRG